MKIELDFYFVKQKNAFWSHKLFLLTLDKPKDNLSSLNYENE